MHVPPLWYSTDNFLATSYRQGQFAGHRNVWSNLPLPLTPKTFEIFSTPPDLLMPRLVLGMPILHPTSPRLSDGRKILGRRQHNLFVQAQSSALRNHS